MGQILGIYDGIWNLAQQDMGSNKFMGFFNYEQSWSTTMKKNINKLDKHRKTHQNRKWGYTGNNFLGVDMQWFGKLGVSENGVVRL